MNLERRQFLKQAAAIAALTAVNPIRTAEVLANMEGLSGRFRYAFTRTSTAARRNPHLKEKPFDFYDKGALLRYEVIGEGKPPEFVRVIHDSWHNRGNTELAKDPIFVRFDWLDTLIAAQVKSIRQDVPTSEKRIDVNLSLPQHMIVYEGEEKVYEAPVTGGLYDYTPRGTKYIFRKQLSRHMQSLAEHLPYNWEHPGVPYVQTFGAEGEAFHGAYWRKKFGNPGSSGCINLPNEDARWLWQWTTPVSAFDGEWKNIPTQERIRVDIFER